MKQNLKALCSQHKQPIIYIENADNGQNFYCEKCQGVEESAQDISSALQQFSTIQSEKDKYLDSFTKYLEDKIQRVKIEFSQTIDILWKYLKDQLQEINKLIITKEKINYYTTQELGRQDLKEFAKIYFSNFQMNNNFQYKQTKEILKQDLNNIASKFKSIKKIQSQIKYLFEGEEVDPSNQSVEEDDSEFEFKDVEAQDYKKYQMVNQLSYAKKILGLTISSDNNFAFAYSEDLPLTAFKIETNKLVQYQKIYENYHHIQAIMFDKTENKLIVSEGETLQLFLFSQQNQWIKDQQIKLPSQMQKMVVSQNGKIVFYTNKSVYQINKDQQSQYSLESFPPIESRIFDLAINENGVLVAICHYDSVGIWNISNEKLIKYVQKVDQPSTRFAQFSDSENNILCLMTSFGDIHILKPDSKGTFYEIYWINRKSSTFSCNMRFCNKGQELIVGNHSLEIYKQNDEQWIQQQKFKINCWYLEITSDNKSIVASDFNSLCLFKRDN